VLAIKNPRNIILINFDYSSPEPVKTFPDAFKSTKAKTRICFALAVLAAPEFAYRVQILALLLCRC